LSFVAFVKRLARRPGPTRPHGYITDMTAMTVMIVTHAHQRRAINAAPSKSHHQSRTINVASLTQHH